MPTTDPPGGLAAQLVALARQLRRGGLPLGTADSLIGLRAARAVGVADKEILAAALRSCWCRSRDDLARFDAVFAVWGGAAAPPSAGPAGVPASATRLHLAATDEAGAPQGSDRPPRRGHRLLPSDDRGLAAVDFGRCTAAELQELLGAVTALATRAPLRPGRRRGPGRHGRGVDWPRSQRAALRAGGEWLQLVRSRPRPRPRPLLVLCDTSGSMERYTRVLLRFCHALRRGPGSVEVFVFSTRLTRITRQLGERDPGRALERVGQSAGGWAGGTRIGDSLHELVTRWGPRVLSRGPVTLLLSDGWETGAPERLAEALARLRRSSWRVIWCNPLMGDPDFAPVTVGMRAALPHLDQLLPVHNLTSLAQLTGALERARGRRAPGRAAVSGSAPPRREALAPGGRRLGR
ncbi:MAG TPA: VWA domain-containing protein [Verrucomicrobiae bacterium]|nr:VWA domain-containing protein [Verrucomicrobiae bacterium]